MQVYFFPAEVAVAPAFEHLAPALVKAWTGVALATLVPVEELELCAS